MALVVKDRVRETSTTTGTGTITLAGAVTGYQSFSAIGNANTTYYTIYLQGGNEWEVGIGTYTASGTTLSRDTILASSNGGSAVNFSAGTKDVFVTYPAGRSVYYDTATNVTLNALTLSGGTANGVLYLNGSKVATSGSALTFDGTNLSAGSTAQNLGTSSARWGTVYATALSDGTDQLIGSSGTAVRIGYGASWTAQSFAIGASEQMRLTSTGLGIGTSSPGEKLTVAATANNAASFTSTATTTALVLDNTNANGWGSNIAIKTGGTTAGFFGTIGSLIGSTAQDLAVYANSSNGFRVYTDGNNERLRITSGGQVNIGGNFTSTNNTLQVTGNAAIGYTAAAPTTGLIVAGNVGIGTSSPNDALEVVGSGAAGIRVSRSGAASQYVTISSGSTGPTINASTGINELSMGVNGARSMLINSSGNLGIGTTTPQYKGHFYTGAASGYGIQVGGTSGTAGDYTGVLMSAANASGASPYYSGAIRVQTTVAAPNTQEPVMLFMLQDAGTFALANMTEKMRITGSGNLGLGVTPTTVSNNKNLEIGGTNNAAIILSTSSNNAAARNLAIASNFSAYGDLVFLQSNAVGGNPLTAGTQRMTLDASGNLGIGTTNPTARLNVASTGDMSGLFETTGTSNAAAVFVRSGNGTTSGLYAYARFVNYDTNAQDWRIGTYGNNNFSFYNAKAATTPMVLDTSGNLGIGTNNPAAKLDVAGNATVQNGVLTVGKDTIYDAFINTPESMYFNVDSDANSSGNKFTWGTDRTGNTGGTTWMTLDSSGNLGIGTTSPGVKLDVAGNGRITNSNPRFDWKNSARVYYWQVVDADNRFRIVDETAGAERVTLDSSGNLGLGVTPSAWGSGWKGFDIGGIATINSPANNMHLSSNAYFDGSTWRYNTTAATARYQQNAGIHYWYTAASGTAGDPITFTQAMTLDASGNLGIGETNPALTLHVKSAAAAVGYFETSSTGTGPYVIWRNGTTSIGDVGSGKGISGVGNATDFMISSRSTYPLLLGTGSTERARITSDGNLLIGTTTSANNLRVNQKLAIVTAGNDTYTGAAFTGYSGTTALAAPVLDFNRSRGTTDGSMTVVASGDKLAYIIGRGSDGTNFINAASITFEVDGTPGTNDMPGRIVFLTTADGASGSTERARITSGGYVGIGNTSPPTRLTIGSLTDSEGINILRAYRGGFVDQYAEFSSANGHATINSQNGAGGTINFRGDGTERARIDGSGQLLIGVTTGTNVLTVVGASQMYHKYTGGTGAFQWGQYDTSGNVSLNNQANANMLFATNNTERARITAGGVFGVGCDPAVIWPSAASSSGDNGSTIAETYVSVSSNASILQYLNRNNGDGTITQYYHNGTAVGSVSVTSTATAYNTSSDYRLKDNQQPLTGSGAFIDALQPKTWDWKSGGKGVGFIAHEVQEVSPGSVVGEKDAVDADGKPVMQAMEYGSAEFIANIVAELQSLRARVAQLEAKGA